MSEDEILYRGLDAFADLGYEAASVRELGRRIGVSHNFINDRYGTKLDFWKAVVDFAISAFVDDDDAPSEGDISGISGRVRSLYRTAAQRPQLYRLIWDEATRDSSRLDYLCDRYLRPAIEDALPDAQASLVGREIPIDVLYFILTGAMSGLVQAPLARRLGGTRTGDSDDTAVADALAGYVLTGLLRPTAS